MLLRFRLVLLLQDRDSSLKSGVVGLEAFELTEKRVSFGDDLFEGGRTMVGKQGREGKLKSRRRLRC